MNKLSYLLAFAAGALIGSAATWYFVKDKYEKLAQEEIDSVKETFKKSYEDQETKHEEEIHKVENKYYNSLAQNYNYEKKSRPEAILEEDEEEEEVRKMDEPYVIKPYEFGDYIDYEQISLLYFADGVLADEDTLDVIDDVEETVGEYFADHFGEYEEDSVYVRNDAKRCEYEILKDERQYKDVASKKYSQIANQVFD